MSNVLPEGEDLRKAIRWISERLKENPSLNVSELINEAIFRFDLSPKDGDFLLHFFKPSQTRS